jgi:hypothetical protein
MGILDIVPAGVVVGDDLRKLFEYGKWGLGISGMGPWLIYESFVQL